MSASVAERPTDLKPAGGNGGGPARRAVIRWAWRLFRREWRQQLLVIALLTVAVTATTAGAAAATNTLPPSHTTLTLSGSDPQLAADITAARKAFGRVEVIAHHKVAVPGSIAAVDLRGEDSGASSHPTLRLVAGRYPARSDEAAMTHQVADLFSLRIGDTWQEGRRARRVVGLVENPLDLEDAFAQVIPGQADPPDTVTIQLGQAQKFESFRFPSGSPVSVEVESSGAKNAAAAAVLALATIGLLLVGLVAVAGFTVMAQRRQRAMGMLGAIGATDRHVRLVMLANGAVVGTVAAALGTAVGLAGWLAFAPRLETIAAHRINRFDLPWWAIGATMALAIGTAIVAAWWPARSVARIPVVAALTGRPPPPQPTHRFAALGSLLLAAGLGLLSFAHQTRPPLIVAGTIAITVGILLLAPLAIRALGAAGWRFPIAIRLALRDLARYQARSGAALGAILLAVGIAATITVSAAVTRSVADGAQGNLAANELMVYLSADVGGPAVPTPTSAELRALQARVDDLAISLHTNDVVGLDAAVNLTLPDVTGPDGQGGKVRAGLVKVGATDRGDRIDFVGPIYVASPALLAHFGIKRSEIEPTADLLTSRTHVGGLRVLYGLRDTAHPKVQTVDLPRYTSDPNTLITTHALRTLGLEPSRAGWLIRTRHPLSAAQAGRARRLAAAAGLTTETRPSQQSARQLGDGATAAGMLLALGVLAMTVGLIRSETANDLRTLAAAGATSTTRRTLTGATAGALALLGALLGTSGAYLALIAWHRSNLHDLSHPPVANLVLIIVGLPLAATTGGWLLAGREPSAIAHRPLD